MVFRLMLSTLFLIAPPEKPAKIAPIIAAVRTANRQLEAVVSDDYSAQTAIDETGVLKGEFSALIRTLKISRNDDGSITILGYVTIKHPNQSRYRSAKSAARITYLNGLVQEAEAALRRARSPRHGEIRDDDSIKLYQARLRRRQAERAEELKKIRDAETRLKHICEHLPVDVVFPPELANSLDVEVVMKRKRLKITATISRWSIGREPEEVGERVVVSALVLKPVEIDTSYVRESK